MVQVELIYPTQTKLIRLSLDVEEGTTIEDALKQSGLLETHPEIKNLSCGLFSKVVPPDTILKAGDRIEIYRPLSLNPKERRRMRAKK